MAGHNKRGSTDPHHSAPIDSGTMCLATTPRSGSIGQSDLIAPGPVSIGNNIESLEKAIADFRRSDQWASLQPIVFAVLGNETFGLGVNVGILENSARGAAGLAKIAKVFLLADLHDQVQRPEFRPIIGPIELFHRVLAEVSIRTFREELEAACKERDAIIDEVKYAVTHPGEVFENLKSDYKSKWDRFEKL